MRKVVDGAVGGAGRARRLEIFFLIPTYVFKIIE